jgi:hypothetical protein
MEQVFANLKLPSSAEEGKASAAKRKAEAGVVLVKKMILPITTPATFY